MHARPDESTSRPDPRPWRLRTDGPALALCVLAGLLISVLPHVLAWCNNGHAAWVADHDERFYLSVGSQAYFNHPLSLADPVRVSGGPSLYKPLPLLPGIWLARVGNWGPLGVGVAWRIFAGLTIGAAWYLLLRQRFPRPWIAAALALIMLADGGLIEARPIYRQVKTVGQLVLGRADDLFVSKPIIHPEWRISTPGVTMAFLLVCLWAIARMRENPTQGRIILAGATFGVLFYVYFYYWTAVGLALWIAIALDKGHRRDYFLVGALGTILGFPSLTADFLLKRATAADWLERTNKFLSIGRFDDLIAPKILVVLVPILLVWILWRHKDLLFLWALGTAGLILTNHQIITKLQIENFHWCFVWGPAFSLVFVCLAVREISALARRKHAPSWVAQGLLAVLAVGMFGSGIWLRGVEAVRTRESCDNAQALADFRARTPASPLVANAVIAGDGTFVDYAVILDNLRPLFNYAVTLSPTITDPEWNERIALDAVLNGCDRASFSETQQALLEANHWGPWSRDQSLRDALLDTRLADFDHVAADLSRYLDRYNVRYVALPSGVKPAYLAHGWRCVEPGQVWEVWERTGERNLTP